MAERFESNSSGVAADFSTQISGGRRKLRASAIFSAGTEMSAEKWQTCPAACTPLSVRPLAVIFTFLPKAAYAAPSKTLCTEIPFFCVCQPR